MLIFSRHSSHFLASIFPVACFLGLREPGLYAIKSACSQVCRKAQELTSDRMLWICVSRLCASRRCMSCQLTVEGRPQAGKELVFATVDIDVERLDFPVSMSATDSGIGLDSPGEQIHLEVLADYSDGTTHRATSSSRISFSSANTEVATVDASGMVTAVAPGIGLITVKYALGDTSFRLGFQCRCPIVIGNLARAIFFISIAPGVQND